MTSSSAKVEIIVLGDIHWDAVMIDSPAKSEQSAFRSNRSNYRSMSRPAGAWLLEKLIRDATSSLGADIKVLGYGECSRRIDSSAAENLRSDRWRRALTELKLYEKGSGLNPSYKIYRIAPKQAYFWDSESIALDEITYEKTFSLLNKEMALSIRDKQTPRIVVINDSGNGGIFYKTDSCRELLKDLNKLENCFFIINATNVLSNRDRKFPRSNYILDQIDPKRAIVVVSTASLRAAGFNIPEDRAVETTSNAFAYYMRSDNNFQKLMECRHLLVCEEGGVFHYDNSKKARFDTYFQQYELLPVLNPVKYGVMSGYRAILIAAIIRKAMIDSDGMLKLEWTSPFFQDIYPGIRSGIKLWAQHFEKGFSHYKLDAFPSSLGPVYPYELQAHPFDHLFPAKDHDRFEALIDKEHSKVDSRNLNLAWVQFPLPLDALKSWNRLTWLKHHHISATNPDDPEKAYTEWLIRVVENGLRAAKHETLKEHSAILCPSARFGELEVVDHVEIDRFLSLLRIIKKYLGDEKWDTPLSLAVFGPPGSGKSSAVEEIFKAASYSESNFEGRSGPLVFNIAQFTSPSNLTTAFHQVQDRVLGGDDVPLIFFDEFDSSLGNQRYAWLKYFLAPMQDGKFKGVGDEGSYRVGKAIFVFAGGTSETFKEFKEAMAERSPDIANCKGKDFISRLRGFLDINGIDKPEHEPQVGEMLALKRAILLRSVLMRKARSIIDEDKQARIDPGLVRAFLRIPTYEHGIRSLVAIIEMSTPIRGFLHVASLPSRDQLRMHVDDEEFLKLAAQP